VVYLLSKGYKKPGFKTGFKNEKKSAQIGLIFGFKC
jgi:hypothetical protein